MGVLSGETAHIRIKRRTVVPVAVPGDSIGGGGYRALAKSFRPLTSYGSPLDKQREVTRAILQILEQQRKANHDENNVYHPVHQEELLVEFEEPVPVRVFFKPRKKLPTKLLDRIVCRLAEAERGGEKTLAYGLPSWRYSSYYISENIIPLTRVRRISTIAAVPIEPYDPKKHREEKIAASQAIAKKIHPNLWKRFKSDVENGTDCEWLKPSVQYLSGKIPAARREEVLADLKKAIDDGIAYETHWWNDNNDVKSTIRVKPDETEGLRAEFFTSRWNTGVRHEYYIIDAKRIAFPSIY